MLKRENRLTKNKHFNYIYKHGQSIKAGSVVLVYTKTKYKPFKVGFSVSNKIGKAVVRNKVKRQMRAIFASIINDVNKKYNYVFIAKENIVNMSFLNIKNDMIFAINKAGLFNEKNI